MTEDSEPQSEILIDFEQEFSMVRVIDNVLLPTNIQLKAEIHPAEDMVHRDFEIALSKIRFWFDNVVSRTVAFSRSNTAAAQMLLDDNGKNISGNIMMLTPTEPSDDQLAALFQAKMTALANGAVMFGSVKIRSNNFNGLVFTYIGLASEELPDMETWMTGKPTYFENPWWMRDDASTIDVVPGPDADLTVVPAWAYSLDFFGKSAEKNETVVRPNFNPTIIDGGKIEE